ncbi:MAG TPA: hypothetical protein VGD00_10250 [Solirubrobacteraceae bacterium]|jgi:hypothetical protein
MEWGAIFILVLVVIVFAVLGGGLFLLIARLRGKQLNPRENELAPDAQRERAERPEHVRVENDQRSRFVGSR